MWGVKEGWGGENQPFFGFKRQSKTVADTAKVIVSEVACELSIDTKIDDLG